MLGSSSRALRREVDRLCPTPADFDRFVQTYFSGVHKRFAGEMDLLARKNLLFAFVEPHELASGLRLFAEDTGQAATSELQQLASASWERHSDPFIRRIWDACVYRAHPHPITLDLLREQPGLYFFIVSRPDGRQTLRYALGFCSRQIDAALVDDFQQFIQEHTLDGRLCLVPRLVYVRHPPAEDAFKVAEGHKIQLESLDEFESVLDLRVALQKQAERLRSDPRYPSEIYIQQRLEVCLGHSLRFGAPTTGALDVVERWLHTEHARFVLILGDFGTGKTFLLYELIRRLMRPESRIVPLLCELRQIEKALDLDDLLCQHMQREEISPILTDALRSLVRSGRVVLFFDGFDELALRTDYERATHHLDTLLSAVEGHAKVVVTSRTQHFLRDRDIATALGRRLERVNTSVAKLYPFSSEQIQAFLSKLLGDAQQAKRRFQLLGQVENLLGLSEVPRMLAFVAQIPEADLFPLHLALR